MSDGYSMLQPTEASHLRNRQTYILCLASNFYHVGHVLSFCLGGARKTSKPPILSRSQGTVSGLGRGGHIFRLAWARATAISHGGSVWASPDHGVGTKDGYGDEAVKNWRWNQGNREHCGWTSHLMESWRSSSTFYRDLLSTLNVGYEHLIVWRDVSKSFLGGWGNIINIFQNDLRATI